MRFNRIHTSDYAYLTEHWRQRELSAALIFDLDGTMWDATGSARDIMNLVLSKKHPELSYVMTKEQATQMMGKTMEAIGCFLFPDYSAELRHQIMHEFEETENGYLAEHGAILYEKLPETLAALSEKYRLLIVSNSQDGYVDAFLKAHKLEKYFDDIEMFGRTGLSKADNIRLIMKRNHIERAYYIGDTQLDEISAREAGISFIHAAYGFGTADAPDATIHTFAELLECVGALEAERREKIQEG